MEGTKECEGGCANGVREVVSESRCEIRFVLFRFFEEEFRFEVINAYLGIGAAGKCSAVDLRTQRKDAAGVVGVVVKTRCEDTLPRHFSSVGRVYKNVRKNVWKNFWKHVWNVRKNV